MASFSCAVPSYDFHNHLLVSTLFPIGAALLMAKRGLYYPGTQVLHVQVVVRLEPFIHVGYRDVNGYSRSVEHSKSNSVPVP